MTTLTYEIPLAAPAVTERPDWGFYMLLAAFFTTGTAIIAVQELPASWQYSIAMLIAAGFGYIGNVLKNRIQNSDKVQSERIKELRDDNTSLRKELSDLRREFATRDGQIQGRFDQMSQIITTQQVAMAKHEINLIEKDKVIESLNATIIEQDQQNERLVTHIKSIDPSFLNL